ncbi:hypothetical protein V5N11_002761 [Cardamine amara subsp. amara]|uniref:Uncharacterized protein n=1 Tax=Cardamine amara subsp. amara TaxID=228776 RepID=A0ABD1C6H2_CARAN
MEKKEKSTLFDRVFSWSIKDILNKDLYKQNIKTIPDRFRSVDEYYQCFIPHLLEETRTELFSSFESLSKSFVFQIVSMETKIIKKSNSSTYGLGNIVLSGNRERMGIDKNVDLLDVFLDERISKLSNLFFAAFWMDAEIRVNDTFS